MNADQLNQINRIGVNGIVREGVFVRFPELVPVVREYYWREDGKHGKLLLVGESNYFNDNDVPCSDFKDAEKWYHGKDARLIPDYRRSEVSNDKGYKTFNKVFGIMGKVLEERGVEHLDGLAEAAFYNYFLRPAYNNGSVKGFRPLHIDREVAGEALSGVIKCINPDLVIFLSKLASIEFEKYRQSKALTFENVVFEQVSHPASPWWNRWNGELGRVKLERLLKQYWVK